MPELSTPAPSQETKRAWLPWAIAAALLLVAAVTSFMAWRATRSASGFSNLPLIRLDAGLGPEAHVATAYASSITAISPDGRRVAYQQRSDTDFDIWTLPLDLTDPDHPKPGKPEPFAHTSANEVAPAFSSDGR